MRKDIFGNILELGDIVAFNTPGYRGLMLGTIVKFTPQKLRVQYPSWSGPRTCITENTWVAKQIKIEEK